MVASLPTPTTLEVGLTLLGHRYVFRRMSWREEIRLSLDSPTSTRMDYVIRALKSVDEKSLTPEQSSKLIMALPKPVRERVAIFYLGSLPSRRLLDASIPYQAPEPSSHALGVDDPGPSAASDEEQMIRESFGEEEAVEMRNLTKRILQTSNLKENTALASASSISVPKSDDDSEPEAYRMVI